MQNDPYHLLSTADAAVVQRLISAVNAAHSAKTAKVRKANLDSAYDLSQDLTARLLQANVICSGESDESFG